MASGSQPLGGATAGSHLVQLIRSTVPPIHPGGRPIVLGALAGSLGLRFLLRAVGLKKLGSLVGRIGLTGTAASAVFFRAPRRVTPTDSSLVVAAADGLISLIEDAVPPSELGLGPQPRTRVSIFLSVFDVHVQRIPVDGVITQAAYKPGKFLSADLDKASEVNERNSLVIRSTHGPEVIVTQIAGLIARRIVCDVRPGASVLAGATYGLIRFGSRVDTYLPAGSTVDAILGQRTIGGETVLAHLPTVAS
ncbi:phosphatidylserine decarboxylase [Nakamurella panacisegetis]|uniref:Phosphatidylserine decarboxylase proenzyme n=1 Tax=Nakamurella panacisegetis TaxID=1090615 RepID=A0A1H0JA87_9ACTN|nr:phosphatidylserine decarboxylase [Nakamurella panacisegetis]SDO40685.1 phosphatidylserine decarboxylase [Nakamurella panacisegetis]